MADIDKLLSDCLYFTANKLSRVITKMAEEEFLITGLTPTYALLINVVNEGKEVSQKEIGQALHMTPSTITRFIDKLEDKNLVQRTQKGKLSLITPTEEGQALQVKIDEAWSNLYKRYSNILGYDVGDTFTSQVDQMGELLEKE